jgi:predicted alpha/beta superfamily hydrolase
LNATRHSVLRTLVIAAALCFTGAVSWGAIIFEGEIPSAILGKPRRIHIYLPPSYEHSPKRRYPVLYIHDGQNAFSTAGPGAAFGWGPWDFDKTADRLVAEGKIEEIIMVAIDCSNERYKEYRGPAAWTKGGDSALYDRYERFLIDELKPKIDREYRTKKTAKDTGTIGSSMGGVISLALGWQQPEVFGKIASLSGAFQVENRAALKQLQDYRGKKKPIRIYLDSGRIDYTGGDDGLKDTEAVAGELRRIGYQKDLLHFIDTPLTEDQLRPLNLSEGKFKEAIGSQHNELYWRLRAWRALEFLFGPK